MGVTIQGPMVRINSGGAAAGTTGIDYDDPLDAEGADTGEPGYLERPRRGGGGGPQAPPLGRLPRAPDDL